MAFAIASRLMDGQEAPGLSHGVLVTLGDAPAEGVPLPAFIETEVPLGGSRRQIVWRDNVGQLLGPGVVTYTVSFPDPDTDSVHRITCDWSDQLRIFLSGFAVLLAMQLIGLLLSIPKISRSARRTLAPIYELTRTAQTTIGTDAAARAPRLDEMNLTGTIETLNAITETRLDTRIVVADEREELSGLVTAINEMLDRLDAAYRSQSRFVSDASHELRTPIAVIQGYANMLSRWGKDDEQTLLESI